MYSLLLYLHLSYVRINILPFHQGITSYNSIKSASYHRGRRTSMSALDMSTLDPNHVPEPYLLIPLSPWSSIITSTDLPSSYLMACFPAGILSVPISNSRYIAYHCCLACLPYQNHQPYGSSSLLSLPFPSIIVNPDKGRGPVGR